MDHKVDHVVKQKATRLCKLSAKRTKMASFSVTESDTQRETASEQEPVVELDADDYIGVSNLLYLSADNGTCATFSHKEPILKEADFSGLLLLAEACKNYTKKTTNIEKNGKKIKITSVENSQKRTSGSSCWTSMKDSIDSSAHESESFGQLAEDFSPLYQFAENATRANFVNKERIVEGAEEGAEVTGLHSLSGTHTKCTKNKAEIEKNGKKIKRDSVAKSQIAQKRITRSGCSSNMKKKIGKRTGAPLVKTGKRISAGSATSSGPMPIPNALQYVGINFYRRIGRWTAHIWAFDERKSKNGQCYLGSYRTAADAARAYDKAQLKHFDQAARLNFTKVEYLDDIEEMARFSTNLEYRDHLKKEAKSLDYKTEEGVTRCFKGGFEVKIRERCAGKPSGKWKFLGRFDNLADAERRYAIDSKKSRNL